MRNRINAPGFLPDTFMHAELLINAEKGEHGWQTKDNKRGI